MKGIEKMLSKKMESKSGKMSPEMVQAKEQVLQELIEAMQELRGKSLCSDMGKMQKVSVMSPDKEGLKKGLEKAEDVLEMIPEDIMKMDEEDDEEEDEE